jgi:hypothetical protein
MPSLHRDTLGMRFSGRSGLAFDCGGIKAVLDAVKGKDTPERLSSLI